MNLPSLDQFLAQVERRDPHEPEYLQAVNEIIQSIWPFIESRPQYHDPGLLWRLIEAERIIQFRVSWVDDQGQTRVNRAFRVQHNSALGPYKGGRSEEHTSELQSRGHLVCRLLLEKKKTAQTR